MKRHALGMAFALCFAPFAMTLAHATAVADKPSQVDIRRYAGDLMMRNYRADGPGAVVLVARGDTVLFRAARGEADIDNHVPLRPASVFRIGSVGKQFSAAGLLKLVEAGKVSLEDSLSRYVPGYPGGDQITVLQLLNHTSGVRSYSGLPGYVDGTIRRDMSTAQIIDLFRNEEPDFAPGSQWAYSNSGYALVGAVIEAASGRPWHVYLEQVLFKPLGMRHTGYGHDPRFAAQQVRGYSYQGDTLVPMRPMSMTQPHAAGALVSNADDLLKWNRALHEGRVLQSATYTRMITPVGRATQPGIKYGFGLYNKTVRRGDALQHGGHIFGFITSLSYLPGPDITVVVLENDDAVNGIDAAETLARRLAAMALGDPYPNLVAVPVDTAALQAAEGVYRFDGVTTRTLRVVDGHLTAQRSGRPRVVLTPIAADDFLYADGFNRLTLEREAGGRINGIRFFANGDGDGEIGTRTNEPLTAAPVAMLLPRAALDRLVGKYSNSQMTMTVYVEGESLKVQAAGQPPLGLRATSPTRFDVDETGASLEFPAGDTPAAEVTIRQNGREAVIRRVP